MKNRKFCSLKRQLKSLDIYAKPITLTFKGNEKFASTIGGVMSLIVIAFLISIFIYKLTDLFGRNQTQIRKNTFISISNTYSEPEVFSKKNITFAFMLSNFWGQGSYDNSYYGHFELYQYTVQIKNQTGNITIRDTQQLKIPFSQCTIGKNLHYDNYEEIEMYGIENYYCPDWNNLTIQGSWYSPSFMLIGLEYIRCSGSNCATDSEFEKWFKQISVQEVIISSYFDSDDYESPIHHYLDDQYVSLQYGRSVIYETFFKKSFIQLNDKLLTLFDQDEEDYFYTKSRNEYFTSDDTDGPGKGIYFQQSIKLDKEHDIYERNVYTITGLLQDVGGFYNSLFFIGLLVYSQIQHKLFKSALISKLYQVEMPDQICKLQLQNMTNHSIQDSRISSIPEELIAPQHPGNLKEVIKMNLSSKNYRADYINEQLKTYLQKRVQIRFTFNNIVMHGIHKLMSYCCKIKRTKRNLQSTKLDTNLILTEGEKRINNELDCVSLLKNHMLLKQIKTVLFTKYQRFLMKFSSTNLLDVYKQQSLKSQLKSRMKRAIDLKSKNCATRTLFFDGNMPSTKDKLTVLDKKLIMHIFVSDDSPLQSQEESQSDQNFKLQTKNTVQEKTKSQFMKTSLNKRLSVQSKIKSNDQIEKLSNRSSWNSDFHNNIMQDNSTEINGKNQKINNETIDNEDETIHT